MGISIQVQGGGTVLFETVDPRTNSDGMTGSFFDERFFSKISQAEWITNYSSKRNGGYKYYSHKRDGVLPVLLHLTGTSRFSDLDLWNNINTGTVFYVEFDNDPNLNQDYVITRLVPDYSKSNSQNRIEVSMTWEEYNN